MGVEESAGVCAYRVIGAKNINGGRSEDLGEARICVYACGCCVNQNSEIRGAHFKDGTNSQCRVSRVDGVRD